MLSTPKAKGCLFLASSLCDGLEDNNIRQVATLLLNKDADPNVLIPAHGVTPFHLVIGNDSEEFAEEVTKLFLRHGGNPNVRSNDGMTPVHVAAAWGRINILQLLLANGGDPLYLDNDGRSPFHYAFDGKYFDAVTMLAHYCENTPDEDDKPKFNIMLDKVLVSNGDIVAEYVASKDTILDLNINDMTRKSALYTCKSNSSSMIVNSSRVANLCVNIIEPKCELPNNLDEYSSKLNNVITAELQNPLLQTDKKEVTNYSFVNLDFDFANLHLSDVMQKEKSLVSQIINHLSSSLASDCTINETFHNYKRSKQKENSIIASDSDASFRLKENVEALHKYENCNNPRYFPSKLKNNFDKDTLKFNSSSVGKQYSKYNIQSTSKKKYKKISDNISPTSPYILDNSIVSMSPNFNTPNHRKRRNTGKTPLTPPHIHNDFIVSTSPNFATLACTNKKRNLASTSYINYLSPEIFKKSEHSKKYNIQMQYSEFNWHKKNIAQSTPRRKKRSIYKFHSGKKIFNPHRYESDITSDEFTGNNILKPIDLNNTIISETTESTTRYNILNTDSKYSLLNFKEPSKTKRQNYDNSDSNFMDLNSSFKQIEKENKSVHNVSNDKKYIKSGNNKKNTKFLTVRKSIFKIDKVPKIIDVSNNNISSAYTTESNSLHRENFVDCVDCDIKQLLNEDLNVNINKSCNSHAKNWCNDRFHESLSHKLAIENNLQPAVNLSIECRKQIYLPDSQRSCFSEIDGNNIDFKGTENTSKTTDLNICKIEKNSSLLSYVSTQEEYKYEDPEEGVTLLERRLCITPFSGSECDIKIAEQNSSGTSSISISQSLPKKLLIDDATLRKELRQLSDQPGPITNTTRQVYQKRLMHLRNAFKSVIPSRQLLIPQNVLTNRAISSNRIKPHLDLNDLLNHMDTYKSLEKQVFQEFASPDPSRKWREGTSKMSFTYLLLDPRITQDLPNRSVHLMESEVWSIFIDAIFYVGKGKRSRPFAHLYDAFKIWVGTSTGNRCKKIERILDIWNNDHGVICLHVFQNIIPVEAYTREAAMIDAIGREHLGNCKKGEYYSIAATWSMQEKQKFGKYLLYKALQIFIQEGESQVFPHSLG